MLKDGVEFKWTEECTAAFNYLKQQCTTQKALLIPKPNFPYKLQTDASKVASGGVLWQDQGHGYRIVAYTAKTFSKSEQNYSSYAREALALIHALKKFRHYLVGEECTIETDQKALETLLTQKNLTPVQIGWVHTMSEFDCVIKYIKGIHNIVSDALSRA